MHQHFKKYIPLITRISSLFALFILIYLFATTILGIMLPFILAWGIASILEPFICFLMHSFGFSRNTSTLIAVLGFMLLVGSLILLIGGIIFVQITRLYAALPGYSQIIYEQGANLSEKIQKYYSDLPVDIAQPLSNGMNQIIEYFTAFIMKILSSFLGLLSSLPSLLLLIPVTILSTFFIARDKEKIISFLTAPFSESTLSKGYLLKNTLETALFGYVKAQLVLMSVTFVISAVGLTLIGIHYSLLIALFASIIDALPIIGTGCVYVPMILWHFFCKDYQTMLHLCILYTSVIFTHQLLEPKVLGNQIGLYPLATLMSMYIGFKVLGILGFIIGPVCMLILLAFYQSGFLKNRKY